MRPTAAGSSLRHRTVHATDELGDEAIDRPVVKIDGVADLLDHAGVHDDDAIRHLHRLVLVVRHHDRRDAQRRLQVLDLGAQFLADLGVERRQRLVQQQHGRLGRQRARQRDALLLSAGQLVRILFRLVAQMHERQHLVDARPIASFGHFRHSSP